MREAGDCADCAVKHLAAAGVIGREILIGGLEKEHLLYWVGHMVEAEEQLLGLDPALARSVRALRKAAVADGLRSKLSAGRIQRLEALALAVASKAGMGLYRRRCACGNGLDVLIPLRNGGSNQGDAELALAVRSIRRNLAGVRRIVVAGAALPQNLPPGVEFFKVADPYRRKQMNIHHALCCAMRSAALTESVLFFADDNVLLRPSAVGRLPLAVRPDGLAGYAEKRDTVWHRSLGDSGRALENMHRTTLNFEAHTPVRFECKKFLALSDFYDFASGVGLCYISIYFNHYKIRPDAAMGEVKATFESGKPDLSRLDGKLFAGYNDVAAEAGVITMLDRWLDGKTPPTRSV